MQIQFECFIKATREHVYAFHAAPKNLAALHRDSPDFRLLHHADAITPGGQVWFEFTFARILPVVMGFEWATVYPPESFSERLIHGPFETFTHHHMFDEAHEGTLVRDILEVQLPIHYGGEWAIKKFIVPALTAAFGQRHAALRAFAASGCFASTAAELVKRETS